MEVHSKYVTTTMGSVWRVAKRCVGRGDWSLTPITRVCRSSVVIRRELGGLVTVVLVVLARSKRGPGRSYILIAVAAKPTCRICVGGIGTKSEAPTITVLYKLRGD